MPKSRAEIEMDFIINAGRGISQDVAEINRWWPENRRGSNASRAFRQLLDRVDTMIKCAEDAKAALGAKPTESA